MTLDGTTKREILYGYDLVGLRTTQQTNTINGTQTTSGRQLTSAYHPNGRAKTVTGTEDGTSIVKSYTYDPAGNLIQLQESDGSVSKAINGTWYLDGRPRTVTSDGQASSAYSYDADGRLAMRQHRTCAVCTASTVGYTYSQAGPLASASAGAAGTYSWTWDEAGRPATRSHSSGPSVVFRHNDDETLKQVETATPEGPAVFGYEYYADYRIKKQTYSGPPLAPLEQGVTGAEPDQRTFQYVYDKAGRVREFKAGDESHLIGWDANGNRTSYLHPDSTLSTYTYNLDNTIIQEQRTALSQIGILPTNTYPYAYDASGRLSGDACRTYIYDAFDRLAAADLLAEPEGTPASGCALTPVQVAYGYDPADRIRTRTRPGVDGGGVDVYDGWSQSVIESGNGSVYTVDPAGMPLSYRHEGALRQLVGDGNGSVGLTVSATGDAVCVMRYDPFGSASTAPGLQGCQDPAADNEVLYRGGHRDPALGLYQFGGRLYDPNKASWQTPDQYATAATGDQDLAVHVDPLTANRYGYVNGDPVNFSDPDGHAACAVCSGGGADASVAMSPWGASTITHGRDAALRHTEIFSPVGDFLHGAVQATRELVEFGGCLVELGVTRYPVTSGCRQIVEGIGALGKSLVTDPGATFKQLGKGMLNWDDCADSGIAHCMGRFVPDIILAITTGGAGKGAQAATAVRRVPRRAISRAPKTVARAESAADLARLTKQLQLDEAASVFTKSGGLQPSVIQDARLITPGVRIGNPEAIKALTVDGSNIADWAKYATQSFKSPSGPFQAHFYRNSITGAVDYSIDYKIVFGGPR
ncbi:MAG TPA: RHS repeat-associated core domain-containing protein [Actinomycetota bacterium]